MQKLAAILIALLALAAACSDDGTSTSTPTVSATPSPSRTPRPTAIPAFKLTPVPTATPLPLPTMAPTDSASRLIFIRNHDDKQFQSRFDIGEIWASDLAGNGAVRLTPAGSQARFVGLVGDPLTGSGYVYYITKMSDDSATTFRTRFPSGEPERVLTFEVWSQGWAYADLAPDGQRIAFTDGFGLQMLDPQGYAITHLGQGGDRDRCLNPPTSNDGSFSIRDCVAFLTPSWSPDGTHVSATEAFYEGGRLITVAPGEAAVEGTYSNGGVWSPSSTSVCAWSETIYLTDFETPAQSQDSQSVADCDWLDDATPVILVHNWSANGPDTSRSFIGLLDTATGALTRVTRDESHCCQADIFVAQDVSLAYWTYVPSTASGNEPPGQPQAVDLATGQEYRVLQRGDWLVGVTP